MVKFRRNVLSQGENIARNFGAGFHFLTHTVCLCVTMCKQLKKLMLKTNIGDDYSVDPAVEEACATVVRAGCANERPGHRR